MSKILSARDLLELVRTSEVEDRAETENIVDATTLGRRIYPGNTRRFGPGQHPQLPKRPRNNTELIEIPREAPKPMPDISMGRMTDDRSPVVQTTRKGTVQMKRPDPASIPASVVEDRGPDSDARQDARTLELERPKELDLPKPKPALSALGAQLKPPSGLARPGAPAGPAGTPTREIAKEQAKPAEDPKRSLTPAQPLRKVSMGVWGRPSDGKSDSKGESRPPAKMPSEPPAAPPEPAVVAAPAPAIRPAFASTPAIGSAQSPALKPASAPEAAKEEKAPASNPEPAPGTPPKSAVASMFSWVTQRNDWAPPAEALDEPTAPAPAVAPVVPPLGLGPAGNAPVVPPLGLGLGPAGNAPVVPPLGLGLGAAGNAPIVPPLMTQPGMVAPVVPPMVPVVPPVDDEPSPPSRIDAPRSLIADEPIALSSEETLVLVHYDQSLPINALAEQTGLSEFRVERLVQNLKKRGVLDEPSGDEAPDSGAPESSPHTDTQPELPSAASQSAAHLFGAPASARARAGTLPLDSAMESSPATERVDQAALLERSELEAQPTIIELDLNALAAVEAEATYVDDGSDLPAPSSSNKPAGIPSLTATPAIARPARVEAPVMEAEPAPPSETSEGELEADAEGDGDAEGDDDRSPDDKENEINYLRRFETQIAPLPIDERAKLATMGNGPDLYALCYDKEPEVIRALWQNINISHEHARFAAFHHRTALGLDVIAQRNEFLKDPQVQRRLVRNSMTSEQVLRRILVPKRLIDIYKVTLDREVAERTRASARSLLRNKFATTDPEDRMELIWKTEARALHALSGLSIDSKTAALICSRQVVSVMLVQNFTRFAATPPSVIAHFLKQALVKRQIHLRNALLKHPNCPSDAKRAF